MECRGVIKLEQKVLGPETVDTLTSRGYLANALYGQEKFSEAEAEFRELIQLDEKALGPENPLLSTLVRFLLRDCDSRENCRKPRNLRDGQRKVRAKSSALIIRKRKDTKSSGKS